MQKALKEQADNFLQILGHAHEICIQTVQKRNYAVVCEILSDARQGAIELGKRIELSEGAQTAAIALLEQYCETAYQVYQTLAGKTAADAVELLKELEKQLAEIKKSMEHDIRIRPEVVFLPYKASMWDSLESVWKAARADEDYDVYVVPIPYYDKNPDGSFGEWHYEGEMYPEYVPVTAYEDYNLAERRPDMIFIHNPYDSCNYVTSVEPRFYAENLRKYTKQLVYIPYYILGNITVDDKQAMEEVRSFSASPGVLYADKVVVQSEDMRQVYIRLLTQMSGNEKRRRYWENKILGLGSPKVDKVLEVKKEEADIPKGWMTVIRKPDGGRKKVVLYNTGISALLQHNERMLAKIQEVLRIFKENRNEIVLLWRPHPLIKATISSMRPKLWEMYKAIVIQYQAEGWGIYDDTPQLHRAIAVSDAYYGDKSSVAELCRNAGMPVMIQNAYRMGE